ncbi:hypothetical protein ACF0H5_008694 [Mactra antiquata]
MSKINIDDDGGDTDDVKYDKEKEALEKLNKTRSRDYDEDYSDMDTGWAWIILLSSFGTFCFLGCALYAVGIIHSTLIDRYQQSLSLTSWAGALHTALISLAGPLSSTISDRYSCRVAIVLAGVLYVLGYLGTALAPNIEVAIFTCGIVSGLAGGIAFTANTIVVGLNFKRRRNLALGIAMSGNGAGLFIFAPFLQFLREEYGPFGFFIILAGIFANMITLGVLCFPSQLERKIVNQRSLNVSSVSTRKNISTSCNCVTLKRFWTILSTKPILLLCIASFNYCLATYLLFIHFPNFIVHRGFSPAQAAFFISFAGIFNIVGRIGAGAIANMENVNVLLLYNTCMLVVAIISIVYPFLAQYYYTHVIYYVLLGTFMGPPFSLVTSAVLHFVGVDSMAVAVGLVFGFGGIGAIIGPVSAGVLVDNGGTYEQSIIAAGSCSLLAAILGCTTMCMKQRNQTIEFTVNINEEQDKMINSF